MTFKMPQRVYFAARQFDELGLGMCADLTECLDTALDASLSDPEEIDFRIFCVEFDPDTNLPERTTDVTEDAIAERNKWLASEGRDLIAA